MHLFPKSIHIINQFTSYILLIKGSAPDGVEITHEDDSLQHDNSGTNTITLGGNITSVSFNITENTLLTNKEIVTTITE